MALVICPGCGHSKALDHVPRKRNFRCSNCGAIAMYVMRKVKVWFKPPMERPAVTARADTYSSLCYMAADWHYAPGWALVQFAAIFGEFPSVDDCRLQPDPDPPPWELVKWVLADKAKHASELRQQDKLKIQAAMPHDEAADGAG